MEFFVLVLDVPFVVVVVVAFGNEIQMEYPFFFFQYSCAYGFRSHKSHARL